MNSDLCSTRMALPSGNRGNGGNDEESASSSVHCDRDGSNPGASVVALVPMGCGRVTDPAAIEWDVVEALTGSLHDTPTDQDPLTPEEERLLERVSRGLFK